MFLNQTAIAWRQVALCNQAQLCKQLCATQSKEIQCNFVLLFFFPDCKKVVVIFFTLVWRWFSGVYLKKTKTKQAWQERTAKRREKKGGGVNKNILIHYKSDS